MAIYAIGDLHLSFGTNKPMNIFGENWIDYETKLKENWNSMIEDNDLVILPGDFSWSMYLKDTVKDFEFLNQLKGTKLLLKGNHDYWWTTVKSMNKFVKDNSFEKINFLFNNSYEYNDTIIVGTRGWSFTDTQDGEKMINRELNRLEFSIKDAISKNVDSNKKIICAMHYPPIIPTMIQNGTKSQYIELMKKYNIHECIYGHLHGKAHEEAIEGEIDGIKLRLVSSDFLKFKPQKID